MPRGPLRSASGPVGSGALWTCPWAISIWKISNPKCIEWCVPGTPLYCTWARPARPCRCANQRHPKHITFYHFSGLDPTEGACLGDQLEVLPARSGREHFEQVPGQYQSGGFRLRILKNGESPEALCFALGPGRPGLCRVGPKAGSRTPCLIVCLPTSVLYRPVSSKRGSVQEASGKHCWPIGPIAVFKNPCLITCLPTSVLNTQVSATRGGVGAGSLWGALCPVGSETVFACMTP